MSESGARLLWMKAENASSPNLSVMVHFYSRAAYLFRTVTMYSDIERERALDDIVTARSWYWGRYAPAHRREYLKTRLFVEGRMREAFSRKYRPPKHPCPVFFYLYPQLSLEVIEERLRRRERLGEPHTKYILVDLTELSDTTHISFTLCDSHTSYREVLIRKGLSSMQPAAALADHGTVFHIREIAEIYERHNGEGELYFEVQVWDPEILDGWRRTHDIP
jgi:hypothetical protein